MVMVAQTLYALLGSHNLSLAKDGLKLLLTKLKIKRTDVFILPYS